MTTMRTSKRHEVYTVTFNNFRSFCIAVGGKMEGDTCHIILTDFENGDAYIPEISGEVASCEVHQDIYEIPKMYRSVPTLASLIKYPHQLDSAQVNCVYDGYRIQINVQGATSKGKHYDVVVQGPSGSHIGRYIYKWQRSSVRKMLLGW